MDAVTLRWIVVGEMAVAVLFGALVIRPDAWVYWRPLVALGLAAFIVVPIGIGLWLPRVNRRIQSQAGEIERT